MTKKFLIVRLSAIGDTIHSLCLASALKEIYPDCHITWVVEKPSAELLVNNVSVDKVVVLPKKWLKSPRQVLHLYRELKGIDFDIAFDVQGLTKSAVVAFISKAKERVTFRRGESREISPFLATKLIVPRGEHVVDKTMSLLLAVTEKLPEVKFSLPEIIEADKKEVDFFLENNTFQHNKFIVIAPWASCLDKCWMLESYIEVAKSIHQKYSIHSFFLGHGIKERTSLTKAFANINCDGGFYGIAPDLSITSLIYLMSKSLFILGSDSFPIHLAAALGKPCIGLYGPTSGKRSGPYGKNNLILQKIDDSDKYGRKLKNSTRRAMKEITVNDVNAASFSFIERLLK